MPDAKLVTDILGEYLTPDQAKELAKKLAEAPTEDQALKQSFQAIQSFYQPTIQPSRKLLWAFRLLVFFHFAILLGNLLVILMVPFMTPWYLALPIDTLLINLMFSPISCPLTKLECRLRKSLGLPEIKHFMGHYVIFPAVKFMARRKRRGRHEKANH